MAPDAWKFAVQREIWSDAVSIRIGVKREDGSFDVADALVMRTVPIGAITQPCMSLPFDAAQRLMDELWQAGCRPSQSVGSSGQVEAIKYHLEDMRKLVFKEVSHGA